MTREDIMNIVLATLRVNAIEEAEQLTYFEALLALARREPQFKREAATLMIEGLMRGDKEKLQLGYSLGSAIIATNRFIEISIEDLGTILDFVAQPAKDLVDYGIDEAPLRKEVTRND